MSDHALLLAVALLLDALFGEPEAVWRRVPHPAVLIGRGIGWADRRWNTGSPRQQRAAGVLLVVLLALLGGGIGALIAELGAVAEVLLAAVLLAQKSLVDHVRAVADGLQRSVEDGRQAVAMIVGRDTDQLGTSDIARAAIESAAENHSDGVLAPALWFLILGAPGILIYKAVNTADSMIGYRTPRHENFGWAAARFDDLLNFVPARLSALLVCLVGGRPRALRQVRQDAPLHRSPNAGWPEAAFAAVLGVALSGPRRYHGELRDYPFVNPEGRKTLGSGDIDAAIRLLWKAWAGLMATVALLALI